MKDDKELRADITAELVWDVAVDVTGLHVSVKNGVATISGPVGSFAQNEAVSRAALSALRWNSLVPDGKVKVQVEDG